jgi:hypothetical protein
MHANHAPRLVLGLLGYSLKFLGISFFERACALHFLLCMPFISNMQQGLDSNGWRANNHERLHWCQRMSKTARVAAIYLMMKKTLNN